MNDDKKDLLKDILKYIGVVFAILFVVTSCNFQGDKSSIPQFYKDNPEAYNDSAAKSPFSPFQHPHLVAV